MRIDGHKCDECGKTEEERTPISKDVRLPKEWWEVAQFGSPPLHFCSGDCLGKWATGESELGARFVEDGVCWVCDKYGKDLYPYVTPSVSERLYDRYWVHEKCRGDAERKWIGSLPSDRRREYGYADKQD